MKDLTKGNIFKVIILFALPIMFSYILQSLYNLADSTIVSNYIDTDALAAVGATGVVSNTLMGFINGATQGFAIPIARYFGAKDFKSMKRYMAQTMILTAILAVLITALSFLFIKPLLILLKTPDSLMDSALSYVYIILAGLCFTALYNMCTNILRSIGDSKMPLLFLMISVVINLFMDILFVKTLGFGIKGAAYATIIAQGLSGFLTLIYFLIRYKDILPEKEDFILRGEELSELIPSGAAMALMGCIVNIGTITLQSGINNLGKTIIAAHTASRRIFDIFSVYLFTIGIGMTTFVSQNMGAGDIVRVKKGIKTAVLITEIESLILIIICFLFGKSILMWLTGSNDPELIGAGEMYIKFSILNFVWLGPLFIFRSSMQGMGRKVVPLVSSTIELLCKFVSVWVLTPLLGYFGIALAEPISWFLGTVLLVIMYITKKPETFLKESEIKSSEELEENKYSADM